MEEDPQLFQQFKGHKDAITASHFSPNGKQVMVIQLAIVDLWVSSTHELQPRLRKIMFSWYIFKVVSSSLDHSLMLWKFQSSDSKAYRFLSS